MVQQKYIYPPQTIEGLEALYANPDIGDGFTSVNEQIALYNILLDRTVSDQIKLPKQWDVLHLSPHELSTSASIFNIINGFNENFAYLNSRSIIISNVLPGNFAGYYTHTGDTPGDPIFKSTDTSSLTIPITGYSLGGSVEITDSAPALSGTRDGQDLDNLVDGVWIRDNTAVATEYDNIQKENWHYGFLTTNKSLTIVKMSSNPYNQSGPEYTPDGDISGSGGWVVLDRYTAVENLPSDKNSLYYNNIEQIKTSDSKMVYILDKGNPRLGVSKISNSSQRSVIYRYDVSGYLNSKITNSIQHNQRVLVNMLGDVNNPTNASDMVNPVAFTVDSQDNIILYDEHDYTFKIYDVNNNFIAKHPKRNIVFRGATGTTKKYTGVSDIHYDTYTDNIYVLTPAGIVSVLDSNYKLLKQMDIGKGTSNQGITLKQSDLDLNYYKTGLAGDPQNENFLSLQFSKNEPNIYYVLTDRRIIKRFKSRDFNIGVFNLLDHNIGILTDDILETHNISCRAALKFLSVSQEAQVVTSKFTNDAGEVIYKIDKDRSYTYDQLYLYTDFISVANDGNKLPNNNDIGKRYILNFKERINTRSNLRETNYPIYKLESTTSLSFKEYSSDFVYNKLMKKLVENHLEFLEKINYKISGKHTTTGQLVYDKRIYLNETEYRSLLIDVQEEQDFYVGVNEYLSTGVLNRGFEKLYNLQQKILKILNITKNNTWPVQTLNVPVEPYLYTNGEQFLDIDNKPYIGYYYLREQATGDIYVKGRTENDGDVQTDGSPVSERFLVEIETG